MNRRTFLAAAAAILTNMGVAEAQQLTCPADVRVPADAPDLVTQDIQFPGDAAGDVPTRCDDRQPRPAHLGRRPGR